MSISHDLEGELNPGWILNLEATIILIAITHIHSYTVYYSKNVTQRKLDKRQPFLMEICIRLGI